MNYWWIPVVLLGMALIYLATRNLFSYQLMFYWISLPGILVLPSEAGAVVAIGAVARGVGMLVGNRLFGFRPHEELTAIRKSSTTSIFASVTSGLIAAAVLLALAMALVFYYFSTVGIALLSADVGTIRLSAKEGIGAAVVMRSLRVLIPALIFLFYMHWRDKLSLSRKVRLLVLFGACTFVLAATGFKGNVLTFLAFPGAILVGLVYEKMPVRWLVSLGLVATVAALVVSAATLRTTDFWLAFQFLWDRLTYQSFDGLIVVVQYFVPVYGFQGGRTFWDDFLSLLYKLRLYDVPVQTFPGLIASLQLGHSYLGEQDAVYLDGEFFVNFGYAGVVLGNVFAGVLLQALYVVTIRWGKDAVILPFFAMLQAGVLMSLGSPFIPMVIDYTITAIFALASLLATYALISVPFPHAKLWHRRRIRGLLWGEPQPSTVPKL